MRCARYFFQAAEPRRPINRRPPTRQFDPPRTTRCRVSIGFQILDADPPAQGVKKCTPNNIQTPEARPAPQRGTPLIERPAAME